MELSVVLVTYNCSQLVCRCLTAVAQHTTGLDYEIIAVDNASQDGTAEMIGSTFPHVKLLRNQQNVGFAQGCNQAFATARGKYIVWLNTDCFLLNNAFADMASYLDTHAEAGVIGARLFNEDGSFQPSCRKFMSIGNEFWASLLVLNKVPLQFVRSNVLAASRTEEPIAVDFVSGACLMFRRDLYAQAGGLDEQFFMYSEEEDFCRRAKAAGWTTVYLPSAHAMHLGGASFGNATFRKCVLLYRSKLLYYRKYHSAIRVACFRFVVGCGLLARMAIGVIAALLPRRTVWGRTLATEAGAGISALWLNRS